MFKIPEYVQTLKPYKAGNQLENDNFRKDVKKLIKLGSNENPLGASPKAVEAVKKAAEQISLYPDPGATELREIISKKFNKSPDQIICGHGSNNLLAHLVNCFADVGEEVLTASGTFVGMLVSTFKLGRKLKFVPLKDHAFDLDGILDATTEKTRIIYLSNPNNPTGSMFTKQEFDEFLAKVPADKIVVLDEAYNLYAELHDDYPDGLSYNNPNLIVFRTFSKAHGLAGLRIGFAVGPEELITTMYKVKLAFEPNILAQKAAVAAIDDEEFLARTLKENTEALKIMTGKFDSLGINYIKPTANFVMILLESEQIAASFYQGCLKDGVIVRHVNSFGVPNGVRINSPSLEDVDFTVSVFEKVYKELTG